MAAKKEVLTVNQRITQSAWRGLKGKISGITREYLYCLQFARRCVEDAMGLGNRGFYRLVNGVDANPSAKELEALLRRQKPSWVVVTPQSGDLLFWKDLPVEWGHVGIAVTFRNSLWVAQNTTVEKRGVDYGGALQLIRLADMATPTTIIRIGG